MPVIPVFTQNVREAYKSFNHGFAKLFPLVAGAWTERKKMYHDGSFLKLADDNKYIKNPEAQNRALRGF